ncbi:MAG: bacterioferritin [Sphaerospermopsis sp. SIO1G2]|nr:bacterioferritin [Sphaerospermopsis sp. SIO1G2]
MADRKDVITQLNILLKNELTAINQYFLHAKMLAHQGYKAFAAFEHQESIEEMKHADQIVERIFLLGGLPNLQDLGRLRVGENPLEVIECDYELEQQVLADLMEAHRVADAAGDPISVNLIEDILAAEEKHIEELEAKRTQIKAMGQQNFLQSLV